MCPLARGLLPSHLPQRAELFFAARAFPSVELNGSCNSHPPESYERCGTPGVQRNFDREDLVALLRRHGVALLVADIAGAWRWCEDVTASFMYLRLH